MAALVTYQDGIGTASAANLNTPTQATDLATDLYNFAASYDHQQVIVRGGNAIGDGLQGTYYWDSDSTADDNFPSLIAPYGAMQGRWIVNGYFSAESASDIQAQASNYAVATGTANAYRVALVPALTTHKPGMPIRALIPIANTGATTLDDGGGIGNVVDFANNPLIGGELPAGTIGTFLWSPTFNAFILVGASSGGVGARTDIASATTTDLGTVTTHNARVTGTTTITSFGSSASVNSPVYYIEFGGTLTLTHNGTSLILPGGQNITTAAGATAIAMYLGTGDWQVYFYQSGTAVYLPESGGTMTGDLVLFSGAPAAAQSAVPRSYVPGGIQCTGTIGGGGSPISANAFNIGSITVNDTGNYNVVFASALPFDDYQVLVGCGSGSNSLTYEVGSKTVNGFNVAFRNSATGAGAAPDFWDILVVGGRP